MATALANSFSLECGQKSRHSGHKAMCQPLGDHQRAGTPPETFLIFIDVVSINWCCGPRSVSTVYCISN